MLFTSQTNQVIQSISNKNGGEGLDFGGRLGVISVVQANKNGGDGVDMFCRGSTASLTATQNGGTNNLVQTLTGDGPCTNVNLNAP